MTETLSAPCVCVHTIITALCYAIVCMYFVGTKMPLIFNRHPYSQMLDIGYFNTSTILNCRATFFVFRPCLQMTIGHSKAEQVRCPYINAQYSCTGVLQHREIKKVYRICTTRTRRVFYRIFFNHYKKINDDAFFVLTRSRRS